MNQAAIIGTNLYQEELYSIPPRILVILSDPWETLTEAEQTTLTKMITALRLNIAAIQIITLESFSIEDLAAYAPEDAAAALAHDAAGGVEPRGLEAGEARRRGGDNAVRPTAADAEAYGRAASAASRPAAGLQSVVEAAQA